MNLSDPAIQQIINLAIDEDVKDGDITTNSIVSNEEQREAAFIVKQNGIIAGLDITKVVIEKFDSNIKWIQLKSDGESCTKGDIVAKVKGSCKALLTSERIALNFLQRMSGIATKTSNFVSRLEGLQTKILDTRKTAPGLRTLDKYAVKIGGGLNHRIGLYDMVLIKDNHIKLAGNITNAVLAVRNNLDKKLKIEVEVSSIEEVKEALNTKVDFIMLDNMSIEKMKEAVAICNGKVLTEASGNISINNIREVAKTGVDFISVGELTHSVKALDISMRIID